VHAEEPLTWTAVELNPRPSIGAWEIVLWHPLIVSEQSDTHAIPVEVSSEIIARAEANGGSIVLLPLREVGGRGVYSDSSTLLVKQLRAAGVNATFLDPPEQRTFEMKKTGLEVLIGFGVAVAGAAAWDALKALFRAHPKPQLSLTYVDIETKDGKRKRSLKAEGDSGSVLSALDKVISSDEPAGQSEEERNTPVELPSAFPSAGSDGDLREAYLRSQIMNRRSAARELMQLAHERLSETGNGDALVEAEAAARQALLLFARSLDWAEDSPEEGEAHQLMDDAGWWVRTNFGCHLGRMGNEYRQRCPVALAHNRLGFSVGGTAVRVCSLCGGDLSECEHLPGTSYMVPGGTSPLGWCRVCLKDSCEHSEVEQYRVSVVGRITEMNVDEISLVPKPANPECRIMEMSVSTSDLTEALGSEFVPGSEVSCDRCLYECDGLTKHDPADWLGQSDTD
jgi:hypothetical protein